MSNNFIENKKDLNCYSLDYNNELLLNYAYKYDKLLINNYNEELLEDMVNCLSLDSIFNKKQVLILSNNCTNEINVIKDLGSKVIKLWENNDIKAYLRDQILNLPERTGKTLISKVELLSRSINKKINELIDITTFFSLRDNESLSLLEKYKLTNRNLGKYDNIFNYYKIFRIKRPFEEFSYMEIVDAINNIINYDIVKKYIKYRRVVDNNIIKILNKQIEYSNLNLLISKLNELIKNNEVKVTFSNSEYTNDFIETFLVNTNMKYDELKNLANLVNLKYNYLLLEQKKKKFLGVFTMKKNVIENEQNLNEFTKIEYEILEEYKANFKNLNNYLDKLSFLKDIVSKEYYNSTFEKLIKGEDVIEDLILYKKIVNINYEIKDIINDIERLAPLEKEILSYCYNNIEDKKDMYNIILSISKLKLYLEIEDQEIKNSDILNKYKKYDNLLNDLLDDIDNKNNLMTNSIKYTWDNILKEELKWNNNIENLDLLNQKNINNLIPCIVSNLTNENLIKLNNEEFLFEKIVILDDITNISKNNLKLIESLGKNIIIFCKNELYKPNNFKAYKNINILKNKQYNTLQSFNYNEIINEIERYVEKLGYIVETDFLLECFNIKLIIRNKNYTIVTAIEIDTEILESNEKYFMKDIYLSKILKSNKINLYRIWSKDWWLNKPKELSKLKEYLFKVTTP